MSRPIQRINPPQLFDSTANHHSQGSVVEAGKLAFFGSSLPSLTGIGVQALAGPDLQIEIEMVVRVPS